MSLKAALIALVTAATAETDPGRGTTPTPPQPDPVHLVSVTTGVGVDAFERNFAFWLELELSLRPLPWLRLVLSSGAAWPPPQPPSYPGPHGILRAVAGFDLVLPLHLFPGLPFFRGVEVFLGALGGWESNNLFSDDYAVVPPGFSSDWHGGPCVVARVGADVHLVGRVLLGASAGLSYFQALALCNPSTAFLPAFCTEARPAAELHARLTFVF